MITVPIYVPHGTSPFAGTLIPKSAIVGQADPEPTELLVVYYEGNKFGAENMVTFTDRAMFAYWRMRDNYPTIAKAAVPAYALVQAGVLYPEYGRIEVRDIHDLRRLCRWLEVPIEQAEQLHDELRVNGVRVHA